MIGYMTKRLMVVLLMTLGACTLSEPNVHEAAQCEAEWSGEGFDLSSGKKCELACAANVPDGWLTTSNPSWDGPACATAEVDNRTSEPIECLSTFEYEGVRGCCTSAVEAPAGVVMAFVECAD